jgi:hypothetical protein
MIYPLAREKKHDRQDGDDDAVQAVSGPSGIMSDLGIGVVPVQRVQQHRYAEPEYSQWQWKQHGNDVAYIHMGGGASRRFSRHDLGIAGFGMCLTHQYGPRTSLLQSNAE